MWDRAKILAFLEATSNKINKMFDELEKNNINEVDSFKIEGEDIPLNVCITLTKDAKFLLKRFSEEERKTILNGVANNVTK